MPRWCIHCYWHMTACTTPPPPPPPNTHTDTHTPFLLPHVMTSRYQIAELFEVAIAGEDPLNEDDEREVARSGARAAVRHGCLVRCILGVLLFPYYWWGIVLVEPALFLYGLGRVVLCQPFALCCKRVKHTVPDNPHRRRLTAADLDHHRWYLHFRSVALIRVGRTGVWLPIPGTPGDPAIEQPAPVVAATDQQVAAFGTVGPNVPHSNGAATAAAAGQPGALDGGGGGGAVAAGAPGQAAEGAMVPSTAAPPHVRFRNSLERVSSGMGRSAMNVLSKPELTVATSSRFDGKLPFVAACLSRDYRREVYFFELFILGR